MADFKGRVLLETAVDRASLSRAAASIQKVTQAAKLIKPINLFAPGAGKGADKVKTSVEEINKVVRNINAGEIGQGKLSSTFAGAAQQANVLLDVLSNVNLKADKARSLIKQYADAYVIANKQAEKQQKILNDTIRAAQGLQPQSTRDAEVDARLTKQRILANNKRVAQEAEITKQKNQQAFLDERATRTAERIARIQDQARKKQQQRENLRLGVGFPLLFGGGPGSVAGGALGALSDSGGGFGGQVLFSAIGAQIDEAVKRARDFGNSIQNIDVDALEDALGNVSSELKVQIQLLKERGELTKAQVLLEEEVAKQTGLAGGAAQNVANSVGILETGFKQLVNAASGLLGIIGAPIAAAVGAILFVVGQIVAGLNLLLSVAGAFLEKAGRWAIEITLGKEAADRLDEAIKNMNKSLDTSIEKAVELGRKLRESATEVKAVNILESTRSPYEDLEAQIQNLRIDAAKEFRGIQKEYEDTIKEINQLPEGTVEQRVQKNQAKLEAANLRNAKELRVQREFTQKIDNLRVEDLKKQSKELEKQAALQRKIADAQISAQLAEDIFAAQLLPDPTPFSRATPEQTKDQAVNEQKVRYAAEILKINNQDLTILERDAELRKAAAKNELKLLNINKQNNQTLKQRAEQRIELTDDLKLQVKLGNATTERAKEILQVEADVVKLKRDGILLTDKQVEAYKRLRMEAFDANNLTEFEQAIKDLTRSIGTELANAMQTALVDTLTAAIQGADDLNEKLQALASNLLSTIGQLIFQAGLGMIGDANQGNILGKLFGTRAGGGPVNEGLPYIVGEKGPELFVPGKSGTVVNNDDFADAAAALSGGSSTSEKSGEALELAAAQAFVDSNSAMATASSNRSANSAAVTQAAAMQTAESYFTAGKSTVTFDTYRVGEMDVVTREDAIKIGKQSARQAEANVYKGLKNMPAIRGRTGVK